MRERLTISHVGAQGDGVAPGPVFAPLTLAGEVIEATIEGIGTLRMPTVAGEPLPDDLTGAELPAVSTYRDR